jgi:uncharacterized protein YyaL (SSP411 family)
MDNVKTSKNPANRLRFEKSPYLLQHADNPVNWFPWCDVAFEKALKENKPIFLSIGYSTCHWCHVMEHESFEDPLVAKLMNEAFISIKVDREERPDIDKMYMTVCQMMTGAGGWPLTIIMTPDKKPFFAATYIPKETRFGRSGMVALIPRIQEIWQTRRDEVLHSADQIVSTLQQTQKAQPTEELTETTFETAYNQFAQRFDKQYGGFGSAPKFPTPHNLSFLLRYWKRSGNSNALQMVEKTLQAMHQSGMYDQVGYGFHRYSTDQQWLLPHFEKMLYDQAMLAIAYTEAFQATKNSLYEHAAREIFTYVIRDLTSQEGGFYSAEDADSEGEEGKFYLWSKEELYHILTEEEAGLICTVYNIQADGNFYDEATKGKPGTNVLHQTQPLAAIAKGMNRSEKTLHNTLNQARQKLFAAREKRVHPHKDDKILTDWNGLMIAALAKGAQAFNDPAYTAAAQKAADFIVNTLRTTKGRLLHRYRDNHAAIMGNLDDYAFFIWGLIELYESSFDVTYLKTAITLNNDLLEHFWDDTNGGFFFSPDDGEDLLVRQKEVYDGATPSGNSVAMLNLLRLGRITANSALEEKAAQIVKSFSTTLKEYPSAYTQLLVALDFAFGPSCEVVIVGDLQNSDTQKMLDTLSKIFAPNKVMLLRPPQEENPPIARIAAFTKNLKALDAKATAYVCTNYTCQFPTTEVNRLHELLSPPKSPAT